MHPTELAGLHAQLALLESRLRHAERRLLIGAIAYTLLAVTVLVLLCSYGFGVAHAQSQKLRLRELDIVDENGRERIVIASPLPDPVVNGAKGHRARVVSAAVQFKSPEGNEQGGIALSDDGSFMFGIDDEHGRERAHLYYIPNRGSGLLLQGENNRETVSLLLPQGGRDPKITMTDQSGKPIPTFPAPR